jgi:hypothetical protein
LRVDLRAHGADQVRLHDSSTLEGFFEREATQEYRYRFQGKVLNVMKKIERGTGP